MRRVLVALACGAGIALGWPAPERHAHETVADHVARLEAEMDRLAEPRPRCPEAWGRLAIERDLRVALVYGYANFGDEALDQGFALAMASVLSSPCRGEAAACGFALAAEEPGRVQLRRAFGERRATIDVVWTAATEDDAANRRSVEQEIRSGRTRAHFHAALAAEDVVVFTGHSRAGGGFGFEPVTTLGIAAGALVRSEARATSEAIAAQPSRLALFAAIACDSNAYYGDELRAANARTRLVLVDGPIDSSRTDPVDLALVDAVLAQRCETDLGPGVVVR